MLLGASYQVSHNADCATTADVNFDHLVMLVASRFLHHKVTIFPLEIDWYTVKEMS